MSDLLWDVGPLVDVISHKSDVTTAAANEGHTGAMIALVPSDADVKRLRVRGGEVSDQLHLTLLYLGEADAINDDARQKIVNGVMRLADATTPIEAQGFSINAFNPAGDEPCLVLGVGNAGTELDDVHRSVTSIVRGIGVTYPEQHTPWVPHVTLAYTDDLGMVAKLAKKTGPVTFDHIRVAFAGDVTDIPLGATLTDSNDELNDVTAGEIMTSAAIAGDIMHALANDRGLRRYWTRGVGAAKIRWGTDGAFDRCVLQLGKHVKRPQGLCAEYHKEATGEWPAEKGVESAMTTPLVAHGSHDQSSHNPHKGNRVTKSIDAPSTPKSKAVVDDGDEIEYPSLRGKHVDEMSKADFVKLMDSITPAERKRLRTASPEEREALRRLGKRHGNSQMVEHELGQDRDSESGKYSADPLVAHGSHNQQDHNPHKGGFHDMGMDELNDVMDTEEYQSNEKRLGTLKRKSSLTSAETSEKDKLTKYFDDFDKQFDAAGREAEEKAAAAHRRVKSRFPNQGERDDDFFEEDNLQRRIRRLEDQLEGDEGLSGAEREELEKLRRAADDDYDGGDFALHPLVAAARKKKTSEYADEPWSGILAVEGTESGDSRLFNLGSLDWAPLPQPLMYQPANVGGHNASIVVGEITQISRRGEQIAGVGHVYGNMLAGEHGTGIRNMMKAGGVSVDVDRVKDADVEEVFADGDDSGFMSKPEMTIFNRGRIRGATLVAFPAFVEAKLSFTNQQLVTASAEHSCGCHGNPGVLVASGHTITIPDLPPAHWFAKPTDVKMYGALTITDEGRVFGWIAPDRVTHRSVKKRVPMNADYSRWMNKETIVAGGARVKTGVLTMGCGHAATENYGTLQNRKDHYDNTCSIFANAVVGVEPGKGVWFAGALRHGVTADQVTAAMGSSLSGDWQPHPDRPGVQEFIAALLVPVPGFPLARSRPSVEMQDGMLVASVVPVRFAAAEPRSDADVAFELVSNAKSMLMQSLGLDPASVKRRIMAEIEGI